MRFTRLAVLAFAAILFCGGAAFAAETKATGSQSGAPDQGAAPAPGKRKAPPVQPQSSITIFCGNGKRIALTTGTGGGSCTALTDPHDAHIVIGGVCGDGGNYADAHCETGCMDTRGSGTCAPAN